MEELTTRKQAVLDILDEQIQALEKKLEKVQPFVNELNQLRATRRVLLSEKGNTSGGGGGRNVQLTQEMVIHYLKEHNEATPQEISDHFGVPGASVRSHLNRHKNVTYALTDGQWSLIDEGIPVDGDGEEE